MSQCNKEIVVNGIIYYCFEEKGHQPHDHHSYYFDEDVADYIGALESQIEQLSVLIHESHAYLCHSIECAENRKRCICGLTELKKKIAAFSWTTINPPSENPE